jgi:thiamine biosynthesis lipoprotein
MLFGAIKPTPRAVEFDRGMGRAPAQGVWLSREEAIMGTAVRVELWSGNRAAGESAIDAVMAEMHRIDRTMSPHKHDSELSVINREAAHHPVQLSDEMTRLIARAIEFSELSDGAFDITFAGIGQLFDYRLGIKPSDQDLERARATVGYRHLILDRKARTLRFAREGVRIDLGGFAKGHAVDNSVAILKRHGIVNATVAAGGDSHVMGDRGGRPWTIGIRDPRRAGEVVAVLPLEDVAISTSGDYERFFEEGGVRFHHLIDPKTGQSPSAVRSVTILADDGLTTEGLSKCLFVMGLDKGMRLIESLPGVDAVVVDASGVLHYSSGLLSGAPGPRQ